MLNVRSNKMNEQNFEFVVNKNDEKIWKITELGTFKDVVEAIIQMQAIANKEVSQLKKQGHKAKLKPNEDDAGITVIDQTTNQNQIFFVTYRDLRDDEETDIPNLSNLVDDYVGNLPWSP